MTRLQKLGSRLFLLFSVVVALFVGFLAGQALQPPRVVEHRLAQAMPPYVGTCEEPNDSERAIYELALTAMQQVAAAEANKLSVLWFDQGAWKFLSHGLWRSDPPGVRVCPPADFYARVAETLTNNRSLMQGRYVKSEIMLLSKLPALGPYLAQKLGDTAFSEGVQPDEAPSPPDDLRPFARTVLAGFGSEGAAYSDVAFKQMSAADSLGTGAAQVAVATKHDGALEKTAGLMSDVLGGLPRDKAVPYETAFRLFELAYAIRFGGADAQRYTAALHDLMTRKVQSFAPPYGMIDVDPSQMCSVLRDIEGQAAVTAYPYCLKPGVLS